MIRNEIIGSGMTVYIERENGFQQADEQDIKAGKLFYVEEPGKEPKIKRALSDAEPLYNNHRDLLEWSVETTHEI